jgi:hypothetical protein
MRFAPFSGYTRWRWFLDEVFAPLIMKVRGWTLIDFRFDGISLTSGVRFAGLGRDLRRPDDGHLQNIFSERGTFFRNVDHRGGAVPKGASP